jgi:hypothetical protein
VASAANLLAVPGDERTDFQQYEPEVRRSQQDGCGHEATPTFRRSPKGANTSGVCSGERDASSGVCGPRSRENKARWIRGVEMV